MAQTIAAGITLLRVLKFLASRGRCSTAEVAAYMQESDIQAARYLATLQQEGFAARQGREWLLGLEGYRLPVYVALSIRKELLAIDARAAAVIAAVTGSDAPASQPLQRIGAETDNP